MGNSLTRFLVLIPIGMVALALLSTSLPRLQASLAHLQVAQTIERYWNGKPPASESILDAIDDAQSATRRELDARHGEGIGFLYWLLARDRALPEDERRRHLLDATSRLRDALARSPLRPYTWLRLARAEALMGLPDEKRFADAMRMSLLTARVGEPIVLDRLRLGLRYFHRLDEETRNLLVNQMLVARDLYPQAYADMLNVRRHDIERVSRIVRDRNPEMIPALEVALAPIDRSTR